MKKYLKKDALMNPYFFFLFLTNAFSQYVPPAFDMSGGASYVLTEYAQNNSAYPPNMAIRFCGDCNNTGNFVTDLTAEADHMAGGGAGQWRGENPLGVSVRGGTNKTRGSFLMLLKTTGRSAIRVTWKVRDIVLNPNTNYIELQWRIGAIGTWNNVANDLYQQGLTPSGTSFDVTLPGVADNQTDLRIRWIYYESGTGARDRLAIDDITISSDVLLPLKLSDFTLTSDNVEYEVRWEAIDLEGIDRFVIEESMDGQVFKEVKVLRVQSEFDNWQFQHRQKIESTQICYFRIRQIDLDGSVFYSQIKSIKPEKSSAVSIYPTVVFEDINFRTPTSMQVHIIDMNGHIVTSRIVDDFSQLTLTALIPGRYHVLYFSGGVYRNLPFVKV